MNASRARRSLGALFVTIPILACGASDSTRTGSTVTVDTIGGIEYVRNAGPPSPWTATERLTLGSVGLHGDPGDQEFGRISGVVADADGRIYVADASEIRVFDSAGEFVQRFGGEGSGPGEFRAAQSIGWIGDTLAVLDPGNARLGMFTRDGEWAGHRSYMALGGPSVRLHSVGTRELYMPFLGSVGQTRGLVFVRQTASGPADTLGGDLRRLGAVTSPRELRERTSQLTVVCTHSAGRGMSVYTADLAPRAILVPAPGLLRAAAWGSEYRIALVDPAGDTTRVIERDLTAEPITDAAWAEEQRKFDVFLDTFEDESCEPRTLPRPAERQLLLGIYFDAEGQMWVERETDSGRAFDVFDTAGRLVGTLEVTVRLDRVPPYIRGGRLYLVVTDDLDLEYVRVFDILGPTN